MKLDFDAALGGDQLVPQMAADLRFGFPGRLHPRVLGRHRSQQGRRAKLGVDQAVLQPPQRRLRFQQPVGHRHEAAGIGLRVDGRGQQFSIGFLRRGVLAELGADLFAASPQGAVAGGQVLHRAELAQVGPHAAFGRPQRGGRLVQIGPGQADGLRKLVHHALGFHVAQLPETGPATA